MKCPNCGKPMRIVRDQARYDSARVWRCPDWLKLGPDPCHTVIPIPNDEQLPIATIAEDMARQAFANSDHQGKKQAGYRRIAGSLTKLDEGREYLSNAELQTLLDAGEILQRLGTAAEKAKKAKKRLEEEEKRRVQQREQVVREAIAGRFISDDLVAFATLTLALYSESRRLDPWRRGWIKQIRQRPNTNPELLTAIKNEITLENTDAVREIVASLSYSHRPVDELVQELTDNVTEKMRDYATSAVIEELKEALAIEQTPNVVSLRGKHG